MPELHFSQRESDSILLQSSEGGKADDTKLFWIGWWTKQEPKRQLWCGYAGWIQSKESGWEAELLVEGFVMNSSYSTYSYDPITSITRLESLVRAHIHVHMVKVSPTFIKRWEGARHREGLSVSTCSQGSYHILVLLQLTKTKQIKTCDGKDATSLCQLLFRDHKD